MIGKRFRVELLKLLEELRRDGRLPREALPRKSMLEENMGERLEDCLEALARFAILHLAQGESDAPKQKQLGPMGYALESYLSDSAFNRLNALSAKIQQLPCDCIPTNGHTTIPMLSITPNCTLLDKFI